MISNVWSSEVMESPFLNKYDGPPIPPIIGSINVGQSDVAKQAVALPEEKIKVVFLILAKDVA